jgi:hypothetical protein
MIDGIDREWSVAQGAGGLSVPPAAIEGPQAGEQLLEGEWLGEVVIRPTVEDPDAIADRVTSADHQDRRVDVLISHLPAYLEAVQTGQHQVQQDSVVLDGAGLIDPRRTVLGQIDDVMILAKPLQQEAADPGVVLNE